MQGLHEIVVFENALEAFEAAGDVVPCKRCIERTLSVIRCR